MNFPAAVRSRNFSEINDRYSLFSILFPPHTISHSRNLISLMRPFNIFASFTISPRLSFRIFQSFSREKKRARAACLSHLSARSRPGTLATAKIDKSHMQLFIVRAISEIRTFLNATPGRLSRARERADTCLRFQHAQHERGA